MKVVVCNGGYKTGSTLTFNIVLKLIESTGDSIESRGWTSDQIYALLDGKEIDSWWAIKSHSFLPSMHYDSLKVIHSYRNPFSVAASSFAMIMSELVEDQDYVIDLLKNQKRKKQYHENRSDSLLICYEEMYSDIEKTITDIADFISVEADFGKIAAELSLDVIVQECSSISEGEADAYTQLRPDNISKYKGDPEAWKMVLTPDFVARIQREIIDG